MKSRAFLALLLVVSCSRAAPKPKEEPGKFPTDVVNERSSLLDISKGATIVSRTGEAHLITSALNTIDGDLGTFWWSPPHDFPQSIVIALGAPSRIDRVGIRSLPEDGVEANHVTFERSLDGAAWESLGTITSRHVNTAQWLDVPPAQAEYLRVTIPDATKPGYNVRLESLLAAGAEVGPPHNTSIEGCWLLNGNPATFAQHGNGATGALTAGQQPYFLEGGSNGRLWRFSWIRGNDYGYAAITIAPDGKHLSALEWHEEAIPLFRGLPWFGERASCAAPALRDDVLLAFLRRIGHVSLFALQFDATGQLVPDSGHEELLWLSKLVQANPQVTLVAHEFRQSDGQHNKEFAQREIAAVRDALARLGADTSHMTFRAAGSDSPRQTPESDAARAIYSSVDVEVAEVRR